MHMLHWKLVMNSTQECFAEIINMPKTIFLPGSESSSFANGMVSNLKPDYSNPDESWRDAFDRQCQEKGHEVINLEQEFTQKTTGEVIDLDSLPNFIQYNNYVAPPVTHDVTKQMVSPTPRKKKQQ
uniref:Uncharacterized protein n=1 Tax=Ditylum brightwellii TaxID=49249 RepID=A0A7S4QNR4_9STRA